MQKLDNYLKSDIFIGVGINEVIDFIPKEKQDRCVIITDFNVERLYGDSFPDAPVITIGLTEENKTYATVERIVEQLLGLGVDRHWWLIGIGGGIVCDITGFVASIYMRGLQFGYVPTTLLAQIDASIGGKTGVNFGGLKNMIGTFKQPDFVLCDVRVLKSLPVDELKNGLVECIKHGIISSPPLFRLIQNKWGEVLNFNEDVIEKIIYQSLVIKADVVNKDEKEQDERKKLNLGHSYGHAIESLSGIAHGCAIAISLVYAARLSRNLGYCSGNELNEIEKLLQKLELVTASTLPLNVIIDHMLSDKKRNNQVIDFVFIERIGKVTVEPILFKDLVLCQDEFKVSKKLIIEN